jgi:predicted PurR-regulated permease PerM
MRLSGRGGQSNQTGRNRPATLPDGEAPPAGEDAALRAAGAAPAARTVRIELSLRTMLTVLGLGLGLWLFARLWPVPLVLATAAVLAGTLNPLLDALEARRLPRPLALCVLLLALLLPLVCLGALIVPQLAGQVGDLAAIAPEVREQVAGALAGVPLLAPLADTVRGATLDRAAPLAAGVLPLAGQAAQGALLVLVTVVLTFYLLADRERVLGYLYALLPRRFHVRTARVLLDMETVVGGYVRGQAITSVLVAAYVFTVLTVARTPHALALAVLAALADLVPFVGGVLVLAPTILATLGRGPGPALLVGVAILLYLWFESQVLVPHVYGRTLRLSPVAVTVALLVGGQLLGIVGALLALPLAAGVRVLLQDLRIDLPGEQTGEETERVREAQVEALYEARTAGSSALRAAAVAARMAEGLQAQDEAATGEPEMPAADRAERPPGAAPARSGGATG